MSLQGSELANEDEFSGSRPAGNYGFEVSSVLYTTALDRPAFVGLNCLGVSGFGAGAFQNWGTIPFESCQSRKKPWMSGAIL